MTQAYIRPESLSPEDVRKVLDFLNAVKTADEIAEAVEIPGERDVGLGVAQRILDKREELGGFTDLQQVADVEQVGPARFTKIVTALRSPAFTTTVEPKVHRRILRFFNVARRPEDLLVRPNHGIQVHAEYRGEKRPDLRASSQRPKGERFLDVELAKQVIERREQISPLCGYTNIRQLLDTKARFSLPDDIFLDFSSGSYGRWDGPYDIPREHDRPVHAALLRTGKVLFFGLPDGNNTFLWEPSPSGPGTFSSPSNQPSHSLFCAGHSFLSDGQLLAVGGGHDGTVTPKHSHAWKFNPEPGIEAWVQTAGGGAPGDGDMAYVRWYPTCVTMGDEPGRVLVVSGNNGVPDVPQMEMYFETSDRFKKVWGPGGEGDTSANRSFPQLYPGLNLLPGGEVFYTPTGWHGAPINVAVDNPDARPSAYFEFSSTSSPVTGGWVDVGTADITAEEAIDRVKGMAVVLHQTAYPFVQVMVVGGGADPDSSTTYQIINLSDFGPEWGPPIPLPDGLSRVNVNLVLLPNGTVFVSGGRPPSGTPSNGGSCWIYDPATNNWYEMDELCNPRQYHSVAVLLPDGRVIAAGNETPADRTIEIFSPPYLFNSDGSPAVPPAITWAPDVVHHGNTFTIETPNASEVEKVVFVRPMAVTHQTDSEQRVIPLSFTQKGPTVLTVTAPNGWHPHALAPKGWYMLFILDADGVPSKAKFVQLGDRHAGDKTLRAAEGTLTLLRVHDIGTGYGPSADFIDVEAVIKLASEPDKAFGFQLRNDENERAHHKMLDTLRDAFNHNRSVRIDYVERAGFSNGIIIRVMSIL